MQRAVGARPLGSAGTALFRSVLGHYPTGVVLVTAPQGDAGGPPPAMIVGTFTSVSLDPPLVGFLPSLTSSSWPLIRAAGRFCVSVLAADQRHVCRAFVARDPARWDLPHRLAPSGSPVVTGALAWIDCELAGESPAGDHWFVTGLVRHLAVQRRGAPLLFLRGDFAAGGSLPG
ncbi:flavin reductase family protein [Streptomyces sp. ME18-1-4]|uniref:flavin reductase family protein n=1 Tax=Streptomyces sp. ME18-1-4 TaxID=3028685 RepID=UPI0029B0746B|nr:flavin reductase family protein [Streptomyces sp. ME18-1-4]MDX3246939.1 flavin reductase family protein [Streptomyces sp. ME18-1-4]